jgi:endoglucanase
MGEWGMAGTTEPGSRWRWIDTLIRKAAKYNTTTLFWDNGDQFDRTLRKWQDQTALGVLINAQKGIINSLPVTTEEAINSTTAAQSTSAYLFTQKNRLTPLKEDRILHFHFNGNTVKRIKDSKGRELLLGSEYRVGPAETIRIPQEVVARYFTNQTAGVKERLTIEFSAGASLEIPIVLWEKPSIDTIHDISYVPVGKDHEIPVTFKGLHRVAAVRAIYKESGKPLVDDWTQHLGPLQAGYLVCYSRMMKSLTVGRHTILTGVTLQTN